MPLTSSISSITPPSTQRYTSWFCLSSPETVIDLSHVIMGNGHNRVLKCWFWSVGSEWNLQSFVHESSCLTIVSWKGLTLDGSSRILFCLRNEWISMCNISDRTYVMSSTHLLPYSTICYSIRMFILFQCREKGSYTCRLSYSLQIKTSQVLDIKLV